MAKLIAETRSEPVFPPERCWTVGATILALILYIFTTCPTIYWQDSGEFVITARILGIGHPTGYPLYHLIAKLFTFLPLGELPFRVNLVSAVFGGLAVGAFCGLVRFCLALVAPYARTWHGPISAAAGLIYMISSTYWQMVALVAEVYALHTFLVCWGIVFFLRWYRRRSRRDLWFFAFLMGLCFSNHMTTIFLAPGMLALTLWSQLRRRTLSPGDVAVCAGLFVLPLLLYVYLPVRSMAQPVIDWSEPRTLAGFWQHITGWQYQGMMFGDSWAILRLKLEQLFQWIIWEMGPLVPVLAVVGMVWLGLKRRDLLIFLGLTILTNILYALNYNISDIVVYYILTHAMLAIAAAVGFVQLTQWARTTRALSFAPVLLALAVLGSQLYLGVERFPERCLADHRLAYQWGQNLLEDADPDAVVFPSGLMTPILWYFKFCEQTRRDVEVGSHRVMAHQELDWDFWNAFDVYKDPGDFEVRMRPKEVEFLLRRIPDRPIQWRMNTKPVTDHRALAPEGMLARVIPPQRGLPEAGLVKYEARMAELEKRMVPILRSHADKLAPETYALAPNEAGWWWGKKGQLDRAQREFERALRFDPDYSRGWVNLGRCYQFRNDHEKAVKHLRRSIEIEPGFANAHYYLGLSLEELGRREKAMAEYRLTLKYDTENPGARKKLGLPPQR